MTPKRCSSSTITRPRSFARTSRESSRWVPIRTSTRPSAKRASASRTSAGLRSRETISTSSGRRGEALAERAEVLLGEDRRRHQHHHLLALGGRLVRGAQRDLGLAVADVAADQAVHRPLGLHVGLHRLDRVELVGGLAVGERALELELPLAVGLEGVALARLALGVEVEQLAGELARRAARARLDRVPALRPERRELRRVAARADVAGDLRELVGGREDLVLAAVLELEVVAGDPGDRLGLEAGEAGDPVVGVDDEVAHPQVGEARQAPAGRRRRGGAAAVDEAPERDHGEPQLRGDEAVGERRLGEEDGRIGRREARPGSGRRRG